MKDASATVELLLKHGADVHVEDDYGFTPLHYAASADASLTAELLLNQGADVHAKGGYNGFTPLHYAASADASLTAELLLNQGADVHAKDNDGFYAAALCGDEFFDG